MVYPPSRDSDATALKTQSYRGLFTHTCRRANRPTSMLYFRQCGNYRHSPPFAIARGSARPSKSAASLLAFATNRPQLSLCPLGQNLADDKCAWYGWGWYAIPGLHEIRASLRPSQRLGMTFPLEQRRSWAREMHDLRHPPSGSQSATGAVDCLRGEGPGDT